MALAPTTFPPKVTHTPGAPVTEVNKLTAANINEITGNIDALAEVPANFLPGFTGGTVLDLVSFVYAVIGSGTVPPSLPQNQNILFLGDSQTEGHYPGGPAGETAVGGKYYGYPNQLLRKVPGSANWTGKNLGRSGWNLTQLDSTFTSDVVPNISTASGVTNVAFVLCLANTLDNDTAQQAYDKTAAYCARLRTAGVQKIYLFTGFARGNPYGQVYNDKMNAANALLLAGYTAFADGIADVRSFLPDLAAMQNLRWSFDETHLTPDGNTLFCELAYKMMCVGTGVVNLTPADYTAPSYTVAPTPTLVENTTDKTITVSVPGNLFPVTEGVFREKNSFDVYYPVPTGGVVQLPTTNQGFPFAAGDLYFFFRYAPNRQGSARAFNTQVFTAPTTPPVGGGFTPPQSGSLVTWYGTASSDYVLSGSNIVQRTDKSGNGHHATVGSGTTAPTAVVVGGKTVTRFAGASRLDATGAVPTPGTYGPYTQIFALTLAGVGANAVLGNSAHLAYFNGGNVLQHYTGTSNLASAVTQDPGQTRVYMIVFDGATEKLYADGVDVTNGSGSPGQPPAGDHLEMGGSSYFGGKFLNGDIGTVAIYSVALTQSERQLWFDALA